LYPIIFHKLEPHVGFGWATRVLAFIILATLSAPLAVMKMRVHPTQKRRFWESSAIKEKPFMFFTLGMFFGFMGLYIPFFYIQSYAISEGIMSGDIAFYMLPVLNASSIWGRIIPNFIADKTGPLNVIIPGTMATCVVVFGWIGIHSTTALIVFCILYGFFSGLFVSIPPTVVLKLSPDTGDVGTRMGMSFALSGLGLLIGTPIAGQLVKQAGFEAGIAFSGGVVGLGVACFIAARISKTGYKLKVTA